MITIRITSDAHGKEFRYAAKATRYVQRGLLGTVCESHAIRQVVYAGWPNAEAVSDIRAPGDWSYEHGAIESRIGNHAR